MKHAIAILHPSALVILSMPLACGCRSTSQRASHDTPSSASLVADSSADGPVHAAADASAIVTESTTIPCPGDDPYLQGPALITKDRTVLGRSLFPAEQREPKKKGEWRVPARVEIENGVAAPKLVLANEALDQCEALTPGDPLAGPFHGVPSSADWKAMRYANAVMGVIVVRDETGAVRAMRRANVDGPNSGMTLARLELFEDGASLLEKSYQSADGDTSHNLVVFDFVGPELREILDEYVVVADGALDRFDLKVLTRSKAPEVSIDFSAHPAPTMSGTSKARAWTRKRKFDPKANRFR